MSQSESFLRIVRIANSIHHLNKWAEKRWGLTLVQWHLLKKLVDLPGSSAKDLAEALGVQPGTLTSSLQRLRSKKFVLVEQDPVDARKKIISVTRQGFLAWKKVGDQMAQVSPIFSIHELQSIERSVNQLISSSNSLRQ